MQSEVALRTKLTNLCLPVHLNPFHYIDPIPSPSNCSVYLQSHIVLLRYPSLEVVNDLSFLLG